MSNIWIGPNTGGGGSPGAVFTLSGEGGSPENPSLAGNFNFSGSLAGGASADGAIDFTPTAAGQMQALVQVDGTTITINASNQLTASTAEFKWSVTSSIAFSPTNYTGYLLTAALSDVVVTLPASPTVGFWFAIVNVIPGSTFTLAQNSTDQVFWGGVSTTSGTGGSIASTQPGDTLNLVCTAIGATHKWVAFWTQGQLVIT